MALQILLIEDNTEAQLLVRLALGPYASVFDLVTTGSLAEAEAAQCLNPYVVILDLRLPNGEGKHTVREASRITHGAPILIYSEDDNLHLTPEEIRQYNIIGQRSKTTDGIPGLVEALSQRIDPEKAKAILGGH